MAQTVAELVTKLQADVSEFRAGMIMSKKMLEEFQKSVDEVSKRVEDDLEKLNHKTRKTGEGFAQLKDWIIGLGIGVFLKSSFTAAADLVETQTKLNFVFKSGADDVRKWADNSVQAFGMSRRMALEYAATFGNLLTSFNTTDKAAQQMSTTMVGLAADLASFNNTNMEDALYAIRAAFVGEFEPMRRYGVTLSAVRMETEAMNMGLKKQYENMTAAERATVIYNTILKDTKNAHNDFSKTGDQAANQQRKLIASFEEARAQIGEGLIPIATELMNAINKLLGWFMKLDDSTKQMIVYFGLALAAIGPVTRMIGTFATAIRGAQTAVVGITKALKALQAASLATKAALGGVIATVGTVAVSVWQWNNNLVKEHQQHVDSLVTALKEANGQYTDLYWNTLQQKWFNPEGDKHAKEFLKTVGEIQMESGIGLEDLRSNLEKVGDEFKSGESAIQSWEIKLRRAIQAMAEEDFGMKFDSYGAFAQWLWGDAEKVNKEMARKYQDMLKDFNYIDWMSEYVGEAEDAWLLYKNAAGEASKANKDVADSTSEASYELLKFNDVLKVDMMTTAEVQQAIKSLGDQLNRYKDQQFGMTQVTNQWSKGLTDLQIQLQDTKATLDTTTVAGQKNREMIDGMVQTSLDLMQTMLEQGRDLNEVSAYADAFALSLEKVLLEAGVAKEEVARLVGVITAWRDHTVKTLEVKVKISPDWDLANAWQDIKDNQQRQDYAKTITDEINRAVAGLNKSTRAAKAASGANKEMTRYLEEGALTIQQFTANLDAYDQAIRRGRAATDELVHAQMVFLGVAPKIDAMGVSWRQFTDAFTSGSTQFGKMLDQMQQFHGLTDAGRRLLEEMASAYQEANAQVAQASFNYEGYTNVRRDFMNTLQADNNIVGQNTKRYMDAQIAFFGLDRAIQGTAVTYQALQDALLGTSNDLELIIRELVRTGRISEGGANIIRQLADIFNEATEAINETTDALRSLSDQLSDIYDKYFSDDDALGNWADNMQRIAEEIKNSMEMASGIQGAMPGYNPAIENMIRDMAREGLGDLARMKEIGKSNTEIQSAASIFTGDIERILKQAGLLHKKNEYLSYFNEALAAILNYVPKAATGAYMKDDGLVMAHKGEYIIPLDAAPPMTNGGGDTYVYKIDVQVPISADRGKVARELYDLIKMHERRGNKL